MEVKSGKFILATDALRYAFDESGRVLEFTDRATGVDYAAPSAPAFYLLPGMDADAAPELPLRVESPGGCMLRVVFERVSFDLLAQELNDNIRLTVVSVSPADACFGRFVFGGCVLKDPDGVTPFSGTIVSLSLKCNTIELPGHCTVLGATAYSKLSAFGVSAAIIGLPREGLSGGIRSAMAHLTIDDTLISPYGGPYGVDAPGSRGDYMLAVGKTDFSDNRWINNLKAMGISQMDFHQGVEYRQADYVFHEEEFPRGASDFKRRVTDVLHDNGMLAGLHTYSGMVDVDSCYVTPVPHPDLYALAEYTLARDIGEGDEALYIDEDVGPIPMIQQPHASKYMTCLMIDEEIIEFRAKGGDNSLTECVRGALGTRAAGHARGAKAKHLRCMYNYLQSTPGSALFYELAQNMATTYNRAGFDMMYFDGLECVGTCCQRELSGLGWYYEALFVREVLRHVERTPLVEYSTLHSAVWAARSRAGAFDTCNSGYQFYIDAHCGYNESNAHRRLLSSQLGWYDLYPPMNHEHDVRPNWGSKIPFTEDVDYLGVKCIAFNSGISYLSLSRKKIDAYPAYGRLIEIMTRLCALRTREYFGPEVRERLKAPATGYRLVDRGSDDYAMVRQARLYARPYSIGGEGSAVVTNPFAGQLPRVRLIAQSAGEAGREGPVVARFDRERPIGEQQAVCDYDPPLDISGYEALGVWVKGIGREEYLNVRLEGAPTFGTGYGDHIISLNFDGWRHFTLCEQDNGDYTGLIYKNADPDQSLHAHLYANFREHVNYRGLAALRVLTTCDPGEVYMGDVVSCAVSDAPVVRPGITVGGKTAVFDAELAAGSYIEYAPGAGEATMYDVRGEGVPVRVEGGIGALNPGENRIVIGGTAEGCHRLKAHLLVDGEELANG